MLDALLTLFRVFYVRGVSQVLSESHEPLVQLNEDNN